MTTQAQAVPVARPVDSEGEFQAGQTLTIAGGHFVHDTFTGFLPPLLPILTERLSLSLTLAGSLATFMQLPAVLNPFIGYMADRVSLRYLVILAPAVTATLMSSLGFAPGYPALVVILLVTGVSVAAFHAPAPAMVGRMSGKQVGKGMSWFMAGGELGRTIGPLLAAWAVTTWTMDGYFRVMALGWATSLILFWRLRSIPARTDWRPTLRAMLPTVRRLFPPLMGIVVTRSFLMVALSVYLPTYMTLQGAPLWAASASLATWEVAGVGGALVSGPLSDRLGRKPLLLTGIVSSSALTLVFLNASGWLLVPVLLGLGFTALSPAPVMLAIVQEHLPEHRAVANGLYISMGFLIRSVTILAIGAIGDAFSLRTAFLWSAFASLLAVLPVLWLPKLAKTSGERA